MTGRMSPERRVLHFIAGKVGSGKTPLARRLARELPAVHLCEDPWIALLGGEVKTLRDYVRQSYRCRKLMGPHAREILRVKRRASTSCTMTRRPSWEMSSGTGRPGLCAGPAERPCSPMGHTPAQAALPGGVRQGGVGLWATTAWRSTPRGLGWPSRRGQLDYWIVQSTVPLQL